jgi:hypothetical protein
MCLVSLLQCLVFWNNLGQLTAAPVLALVETHISCFIEATHLVAFILLGISLSSFATNLKVFVTHESSLSWIVFSFLFIKTTQNEYFSFIHGWHH